VLPLRRWAVATAVAVAVAALLELVRAFLPLVSVWLARRASAVGGESWGVVDVGLRVGGFALAGVAFAVAGVCFVGWLYRARANLAAVPGARPTFPAALAVAGWLVPVVNYVLPGLVVADAAAASAAGDAAAGRRLRLLAGGWWVAFVAARVGDTVVLLRGLADDELAAVRAAMAAGETIDAGRALGAFGGEVAARLPVALLYLVAAVAALVLVQRVTAAQDARLGGGGAHPAAPVAGPAVPAAGPPAAGPPAPVPAAPVPAAAVPAQRGAPAGETVPSGAAGATIGA
jgi:hypothetical protein